MIPRLISRERGRLADELANQTSSLKSQKYDVEARWDFSHEVPYPTARWFGYASAPRYQFVCDPSRRCRCGASQNLNGSFRLASSTSIPSPGMSCKMTLPGCISGCTGKMSRL